MALKDLTLNFDDKTIVNEYMEGKRLILQKVVLALQCWTGDWFLDGNYGIMYDMRLANKSLLLADIQDIIMSVDGVMFVEDIEVKVVFGDNVRNNQRIFQISANIITQDDEQVTLNSLVPIIGS